MVKIQNDCFISINNMLYLIIEIKTVIGNGMEFTNVNWKPSGYT